MKSVHFFYGRTSKGTARYACGASEAGEHTFQAQKVTCPQCKALMKKADGSAVTQAIKTLRDKGSPFVPTENREFTVSQRDGSIKYTILGSIKRELAVETTKQRSISARPFGFIVNNEEMALILDVIDAAVLSAESGCPACSQRLLKTLRPLLKSRT